VQDPDGKFRRHLLSVRDHHGKTTMTLGTKLALAYLEAKNIKMIECGSKAYLNS
jgi:CHASE2 domain-containing sensor protein